MKFYSMVLAVASFSVAMILGSTQGLTAQPAGAHQKADPDSRRLSRELAWPKQGVWLSADKILIGDISEGRLEISTLTGNVQESPLGSQLSSWSTDGVPYRPSAIRRSANDDLLIENQSLGQITRVGVESDSDQVQSSQVLWNTASRRRPTTQGRPITNAGGDLVFNKSYDWVPLGEGMLAFADYFSGSGNARVWSSSLVYMTSNHFEPIGAPIVDPHAGERDYHIRNLSLLTANKYGGFFLRMSTTPQLYWVDSEGRLLKTVDLYIPGYEQVPPLKHRTDAQIGPEHALTNYKDIEAHSMLQGLYSQSDRLFLLAKSRNLKVTGTAWELLEIDIEELRDSNDNSKITRIKSSTPLLSRSAHLIVIPGEPKWAILEQAEVEPIGDYPKGPYMPTRSITLASHPPVD